MEKPDILQEMPLLDGKEAFLEWYEGTSPAEKKDLTDLGAAMPRVGPIEGPQRRAFQSKANTCGYGGAAGGGKSALIVLLALLEHKQTVIFRNDAKQLSGLINDAILFHGTQSGLNRQQGHFYFGPGHFMEWGGIGKPGSEMSWRGRAHDFLAADEATEMSLTKLQMLMTWLRSTDSKQRVRALFTFNPPGNIDPVSGKIPVGRWVIPYFAPWIDHRHPNPAQPGELRWFFTNEAGESEEVPDNTPREVVLQGQTIVSTPQSRTFIPATYKDNPYQSSDYASLLASQPEPLRSQMLLGSFRNIIADHPKQVLPTKWVEEAMERWKPRAGLSEMMTGMGVDVARGGDRSFTVLSRRHGLWWDQLVRRPGTETRDGHSVASLIAGNLRNQARVYIDATGVGSSAVDYSKDAGMNVIPVHVAGRKGLAQLPGNPKLYNRRTWLWWAMRVLLDPARDMGVALPPDKRLQEDLCTPMFNDSVHGGAILVESKEDIRVRLGRSTDDADAVLLTLFHLMQESIGDRLRPSRPKKIVKQQNPTSHNGWMSF